MLFMFYLEKRKIVESNMLVKDFYSKATGRNGQIRRKGQIRAQKMQNYQILGQQGAGLSGSALPQTLKYMSKGKIRCLISCEIMEMIWLGSGKYFHK